MAQDNRGEFSRREPHQSPEGNPELALIQSALISAQDEIRRYESQRLDWQCQVAEKQLLLQSRAVEIEQTRAEISALRNRISELQTDSLDLVVTGSPVTSPKTKNGEGGAEAQMRPIPRNRRWRAGTQKRRWRHGRER